MCDGLKAGQFAALPQHRCERGGLAHRLRELGNQPGEGFTEGHTRGLPVDTTNRLGDLEQAVRRRFSFLRAERQLVGHGAIEIRHPHFQAMGHRQLVAEHQQFVWQRGPDLQVLETSELVQVLHFRQQRRPRFDGLERFRRRPAAKEPSDPFRWRQ